MRACGRQMLLLLLVMLVPRTGWSQTPIQYDYDELGRLIAVIDPGGDTAVYHYDAVGNVLSIDRHASSQVSIISFSPTSGPVGTTVTIYGTGFSATASQDTATVHGTTATISNATTTKLVITVPSGATTGTIAVSAPAGSATSAASFTVTTGSSVPTITSFTPTIGVAGTSVAVTGTNFNTVPAHNRLKFNLTGASASAATATSLTALVPIVTGSGRITVVTPGGSVVSTDDFFVPPTSYAAGDVGFTSRMAIGDTNKVVTLNTASKIGLVAFDATGGQRVSVKATSTTMTSALLSLQKVDNTTMGWVSILSGGTGFLDVLTLPLTGTYAIAVDPDFSSTGSTTLALYDVPADVTGSITPGGSSVTVTVTAPGQNARLTFSGTANDRVSLKSASTTMASGIMSLLNPDGTTLTSILIIDSGTAFLESATLPTTGTYTVLIDPLFAATGATTVTAYAVPADTTGSVTINSSAVTVTTTQPGQNGSLTFSATAAQQVAVHWASNTIGSVLVKLLGTNGTSVLAQALTSASSFDMPLVTLPATGTYTISVDPSVTNTGSIALSVTASSATLLVNSTGPPTEMVVAGSASVTVGVAGGPANTTDWVGLYELGAADYPTLAWQYLNGSQTAPGTGVASASLTFTMPSAPGKYEFRFFANNGYTRLAFSTNVATTSTGSMSVNTSALGSPVTVAPSASVSVAVSGGPGNTTDWVGLYAIGGSLVSWNYLNGSHTAPGTGVSSATLTFTMPSTAGTYYEFRFLANDGYARLAVSTTVAVIAP